MAIPTTGYDTATITNPSSALTDFTLIVDLSRMSTDWWSGVNTSDGTRGRASKDDGVTELATDWIDFNDTAETGLLRVKWSGTLASSGAQIIRIYPPNTANTAYGVSDTYGQYNAYDSAWEGYWPLQDNANDRTVNQVNGTPASIGSASSPTIGGVTGKFGSATDFDNASNSLSNASYIDLGLTLDILFPMTMLSWTRPDSLNTGFAAILAKRSVSAYQYHFRETTALSLLTTGGSQTTSLPLSALTWEHAVVSIDTSGDAVFYRDMTSENPTGTMSISSQPVNSQIGYAGLNGDAATGTAWNGALQDTQIHSTNRASSWISEEYSQTNDNATFWGTWTWNSAGGGFTLTADAGTFTATGQDSSLLFDRKVSAESGTFSTTGQAAGLFTARVLTADGGSYATVGQDANLTLGTNIILSAETGTFSVTGQAATIIHNKIINGETGEFTLSGQPASLIWSGEDFYFQLLTIGSDIQSALSLSSSIQSTIQLEGKI